MTVKGIVRDTEKNKNGVFIEITPNLDRNEQNIMKIYNMVNLLCRYKENTTRKKEIKTKDNINYKYKKYIS